MHTKISALIISLENLYDSIIDKKLPNENFNNSFGWNYPSISVSGITNTILNITEKLKEYKSPDIPKEFEDTVDGLISDVNKQTEIVKSYLAHDAGRINALVPSILLLLQVVSSDIETQLYSWNQIDNRKLVPKNLKNRLRALSSQLDSLEGDCENINDKVSTINNAYETAESLPAVIQDLNDAREKLSSTIKETRDDINKYKNEISEIKAYIGLAKSDSESMRDEIRVLLANTNAYAQSASSLVEQCDDALQITTTQGLAAGFDQKAKELQKSIWVWIVGLLVALAFGIGIGSSRVAEFTDALKM